MNEPTHKKFVRMIFITVVSVFLFSTLVFAIILLLQFERSNFTDLDFQGASGAASIIPAFAGVLLGSWAIYFQIKTNSTSYRLAESILIDIIQLKNINQNAIFIIKSNCSVLHSLTDDGTSYQDFEPDDQKSDFTDPSEEKEQFKFRIGIEKAKIKLIQELAENLKTRDMGPDYTNTLGFLANKILPVIKNLSDNILEKNNINYDFSEIEKSLNIAAFKYEHVDDEEQLQAWMLATLKILLRIDSIISTCLNSGTLDIGKIEYFLINDSTSKIRQKIDMENEILREYIRKKSNRSN